MINQASDVDGTILTLSQKIVHHHLYPIESNMDDAEELLALAQRLPDTEIRPGLTDDEIAALERLYALRFPEDLRAFLSAGLPAGKCWPDWRGAIETIACADSIRRSLSWPLEGLLFDVEKNAFWDPAWGDKPLLLSEATAVAKAAVEAAPVLIPIYAHRYLPSDPCLPGNPVFSVYQTDIIVYGRNLSCYLHAENGARGDVLTAGAREIRAWTHWMNADWMR